MEREKKFCHRKAKRRKILEKSGRTEEGEELTFTFRVPGESLRGRS